MNKKQLKKEIDVLKKLQGNMSMNKEEHRNPDLYITYVSKLEFLRAADKKNISIDEDIANEIISDTQIERWSINDDNGLMYEKQIKIRKIIKDFNNKKIDVFKFFKMIDKVDFFFSSSQIKPAFTYKTEELKKL